MVNAAPTAWTRRCRQRSNLLFFLTLCTCAGYEVQTVRIVTHALSAAQTGEEAAETAAMLERLCLTCGISFLSLGCTSDESLLEQGCFSKIAACTRYTSCSFRWLRQGVWACRLSSWHPQAPMCLPPAC